MVAEKKVSRKQLLKEPDEFMTTTGQVLQWIRDNTRTVGIGIAVVAVCVVAAVGYYAYQRQQNLAAHELFEKAENQYEAAVRATEPVKPEAWDLLFAQFDFIAQSYGAYPAGEMALLYTGHVLYRKEDYKAALDRYTKMQSTHLIKTGLEPLIRYQLATTRFALHDYEEAKKLFEDLAKDTNSPYRREASSSIARIYEAMHKNKEAVQAYKQYLKMFPEAPDAAFVKARISDLSGEA
jgi:predicted negative regulator of RcsB-dependent stress response